MKIIVQLNRRLPWWRRSRHRRWFLCGAVVMAILLLLIGPCRRAPDMPIHPGTDPALEPPAGWGQSPEVVSMTVTAYSADPESTGWEYNDSGAPVYTYGPNKGKEKKVGVTADGTVAAKGTIAADTDHYPFGTRMYVPGYGWGAVRDRGGAIKTPHRIDIFFPSRELALQWGRRHLDVTVIRPPSEP